MIIMMMIVTTTLMITIPITIRITIPILIVISQCLLVRRRGSGVVGLGHEASSRILIYRKKKRNRVRERCVSYIYIYIYIYTHIHTYIHTNTPQCPAPNTPSSLVVHLFLIIVRRAHSARGLIRTSGSYVAFFLAWTLGDITWQNARAARDPILGPSHPDHGFIPDLGQKVCAARVPIAGLIISYGNNKKSAP